MNAVVGFTVVHCQNNRVRLTKVPLSLKCQSIAAAALVAAESFDVTVSVCSAAIMKSSPLNCFTSALKRDSSEICWRWQFASTESKASHDLAISAVLREGTAADAVSIKFIWVDKLSQSDCSISKLRLKGLRFKTCMCAARQCHRAPFRSRGKYPKGLSIRGSNEWIAVLKGARQKHKQHLLIKLHFNLNC